MDDYTRRKRREEVQSLLRGRPNMLDEDIDFVIDMDESNIANGGSSLFAENPEQDLIGPENPDSHLKFGDFTAGLFLDGFDEKNGNEPSPKELWHHFVNGTGPDEYEFGDGTVWVEQMKSAPAINAIRRDLTFDYVQNGQGKVEQTHIGFPVPGYKGAQIQNMITRSPVRQMIGGYLVEAEIKGDEIHYKIDNDMSYKSYSSSYLGGEGPDYPRTSRREMGTIPMTLKWSEKIER